MLPTCDRSGSPHMMCLGDPSVSFLRSLAACPPSLPLSLPPHGSVCRLVDLSVCIPLALCGSLSLSRSVSLSPLSLSLSLTGLSQVPAVFRRFDEAAIKAEFDRQVRAVWCAGDVL